jgi:hypothetical protein
VGHSARPRLAEFNIDAVPTIQPATLGQLAAIVDRVTFNAHIIETGTQSYRLRTSKTTARRKRAS